MPPRGRGVFGGQVISQAVVSATNCVDPAYGLHVSCPTFLSLKAVAHATEHMHSLFM